MGGLYGSSQPSWSSTWMGVVGVTRTALSPAEVDEAAGAACDGGGEAGVVLVAAADRRMAAQAVPDRGGDAGVARDDLPVAVRAGQRRPAARADQLPAHRARDAPPEGHPAAGRLNWTTGSTRSEE